MTDNNTACCDNPTYTNFSKKRSVKGFLWVTCKDLHNFIDTLKSYHQVSGIVAQFIGRRHNYLLKNTKLVHEHFLDPKLKNLMPNPYLLKDMKEGVNVVKNIISKNKKIAIFADYDVDGSCSAALLHDFLLQYGALECNIFVYVADREKDGYGPNIPAMDKLKQWGADLIISVDCGIVAFDAINHARKIGCEFIVLDHHKSTNIMPNANSVINPNRVDEDIDLKYLCGAGVVFMFCAGLAIEMQDKNKAVELKKFLMDSLDLVAIATICDIVPLVRLNRAIVKHGLSIVNKMQRVGIKALLNRQSYLGVLSAKDIGFRIGPAINACGRVGESIYGFKLLTVQLYKDAEKLAKQIYSWNQSRIDIESKITEETTKQISNLIKSKENYLQKPFIFVHEKKWNEGVIGIVCSRVQNEYHKLSIVGSQYTNEDGNEYIKASCRSIAEIDIGAIVLEAVDDKILVKGGGHKMAAGFTIELNQLGYFEEFLTKKVTEMLAVNNNNATLEIDCIISANQIGKSILSDIEILEPFGAGNESPIFCVNDIIIVNAKIVGLKHISVSFKNVFSGVYFNGICFRSVNTELGNQLLNNIEKHVSIVCNIEKSSGKFSYEPSVIIIDAKF
ncbi:MAG: single-stranded-DNA-specific exonuclease RecJ [Alphaproteobacteria bacterium]|nr:single-stranded-DNA-specific exonuclease RecJ [Rickettsiales bacterium]